MCERRPALHGIRRGQRCLTLNACGEVLKQSAIDDESLNAGKSRAPVSSPSAICSARWSIASSAWLKTTEGAATAASLKPHIQPFINYSPLNFFAIIFCMMVGTASLPHILMRYFTTPSGT
jgi:Na+(H+)/acetate symporter ActP